MRVGPSAAVVLWAVAVAAAPSTARAQALEWTAPTDPSQDDIAAAREDYAQGLEELDAGESSRALGLFRSSYERSGVAASLYNAAVALERMGRPAEARAALDALDAAGTPEAVRGAVDDLSERIEAQIAHLLVEAIPEGASLTLDQRSVPLEEGQRRYDATLDPGAHALAVRAGTGPPFTWEDDLLPGERRSVVVELAGGDSGGDDALVIGLGVGAGALAVVVAVVVGVVLAGSGGQLSPTAPHVVRLP